jgi:hypothetical protein
MSDDCEMCDGSGEVEVDGHGCVGCPACIQRERDAEIAKLQAEAEQLNSELRHRDFLLNNVQLEHDRLKSWQESIVKEMEGPPPAEPGYLPWLEHRISNLAAKLVEAQKNEHVHAQHGETGRQWGGPRYKLPEGFFETITSQPLDERITCQCGATSVLRSDLCADVIPTDATINWLRCELCPPTPLAGEPAVETIECECCRGVGTIDERLGGYGFSNPAATCPDCDGHGEIELTPTAGSPTPECGACDKAEPCANLWGICSRHGGAPSQKLPGGMPAVPVGHFWRGDVDRSTCKHCGRHHDEHIHTDEASRCPDVKLGGEHVDEMAEIHAYEQRRETAHDCESPQNGGGRNE